MAKYKIAFYCPDSHIEYNVHTLDRTGVGGGITARIRTAHALARIGHQVTAFVNCPREETIQGVRYVHYSNLKNLETEIFIVTTSGAGLDLGNLQADSVRAKKKFLMLSGVEYPQKTSADEYDYVYIPSDYIRKIAVENWHIKPQKIFTTYYGISSEHFKNNSKNKRDLKKIVYFSHPSKGLDSAIAVFRILKRNDPSFTLHVYGGNKLWGEQENEISPESGLVYHGLIGQKELAHCLQKIGFCLNLQSREEPFGMVITESMAAGCLVLASPVGAYLEIINNGFNGFLIPGNHSEFVTNEMAAKLILYLLENPDYVEYIRKNAINTPFSWHTIAKTWEGHWDWQLQTNHKQDSFVNYIWGCSQCGGNLLPLADGLHCIECGNYQK